MKIRVSQVKSAIGRKEHHKRILASLGLGRICKSRIHDDSAVIKGMIKKVDYLLKVEQVEEN